MALNRSRKWLSRWCVDSITKSQTISHSYVMPFRHMRQEPANNLFWQHTKLKANKVWYLLLLDWKYVRTALTRNAARRSSWKLFLRSASRTVGREVLKRDWLECWWNLWLRENFWFHRENSAHTTLTPSTAVPWCDHSYCSYFSDMGNYDTVHARCSSFGVSRLRGLQFFLLCIATVKLWSTLRSTIVCPDSWFSHRRKQKLQLFSYNA